jgi:ribosomal protein L21E
MSDDYEYAYAKNIEKTKDQIRMEHVLRELEMLANGGIVEIMFRNPNVDSWAKEHEQRITTLKAERDRLKHLLRDFLNNYEFGDEVDARIKRALEAE